MKVVELSEHQRNEIQAAGDVLRRQEQVIVENKRVLARIWYAHFLALKEAGFSDAQALDLCWR